MKMLVPPSRRNCGTLAVLAPLNFSFADPVNEMNVVAIINELRQELERIDGLILALESLRSGRKRGRPPKALQALRSGAGAGSSPAAQKAAAAVKDAETRPAVRGKKRAAKKKSKSET